MIDPNKVYAVELTGLEVVRLQELLTIQAAATTDMELYAAVQEEHIIELGPMPRSHDYKPVGIRVIHIHNDLWLWFMERIINRKSDLLERFHMSFDERSQLEEVQRIMREALLI